MKRLILIGATLAVGIATIFVYTRHERVAPQTISVQTQTSLATTTSAVFKIADNTYSVDIRPDETVIDAMRALASTGTFTFTGRDYPGLGFFVDSINGAENTGGKYWILYINGVSATTGVSMTTIKAGDRIEWKYEKGF